MPGGVNSPSMFYPRSAVTIDISSVDHEADLIALYVGVGGTVIVRLADDSADVTLLNVPSGTFIPLNIKKVEKTGTTATNMVGFKLRG